MSDPIFQEPLFADPLGLRFRHLREKARWSKESVAQQLKLPTSVIDAIEREDWARLGAPIYVRSYVGSYAKLLGLPATIADDILRDKPAPELIHAASSGSGMRRMVDRSVRNVAYLVMTVVIVGSVVMLVMHFQAPTGTAQVMPLDTPAIATAPETSHRLDATAPSVTDPAAGPLTASPVPTNVVENSGNSAVNETPVLASLAPSMPTVAPPGDDLVLKFRDQSWIEVLDTRGQRVERGLVAAGSERRFGVGQIAHITLGNAQAVDASRGGKPIDLTPFRDANVARLSLSSDGNLAPPGG